MMILPYDGWPTQILRWMALQKRTHVHVDHIDNDSVGTSDDSAGSSSKKRTVTRKTIEGWISQYDKEFHMMWWLDFLMQGDGKHVAEMRHKVCCEFSERLISLRNYCPTFIEGTDNVRSSAVVDHAKSAMHSRAMDLYCIKTQALTQDSSPDTCYSITGHSSN